MKRVQADREPHGAAAILAAVVIVLATLNLSVPYFALAPGPTQDVAHLIAIDGVQTREVNGRLLLTTVSLGSIEVIDAIRGWFDPAVAFVSRSVIIPDGETEDDAQVRTSQQMEESQLLAAAAALSYLGYEVTVSSGGARVQDVALDVPAAKVLQRGDVVVGADGREVMSAEELIALIAAHKVGDAMDLSIERGEERFDIQVQTVENPQKPDEPIIGVVIDTLREAELPLAVDIQSMGIGGPSAGLMFAIGVVELVDEEDHLKGRVVAGTGEILLGGEVRDVGGVRQKLEGARRDGADLFLVPIRELELACLHNSELNIVGVSSLEEAIRTLDGDVPAERTCG